MSIENLLTQLNTYSNILNNIFEYESGSIETKLVELKIPGMNTKSFSFTEVKKIINSTLKDINLLKDNAPETFYLLINDFSLAVTNDAAPIKKEFTELCSKNIPSSYAPQKYQNCVHLESILSSNSNNESLKKDFPYDEVFKENGLIYKKLQNILAIYFWIKIKLINLSSKSKELLESYKSKFEKHDDVSTKLKDIDFSKIENYAYFVDNMDNIKDSEESLKLTQTKGLEFINDISQKTIEVNDLIVSLKTTTQDTQDLLNSNKDLASHLTSKEMSSTLSEAANYYNESKNTKYLWIIIIGLTLLAFTGFLVYLFDVRAMAAFENKPFILIIYSMPKILVFGVLSYILKFLITEYRKEAQTALDFKHRQAIADVTPGFRKQLDNKEKQDQLVEKAFEVISNNPTSETKDSNKLFYESFLDVLKDNEFKSSISKVKDSLISYFSKNQVKDSKNDDEKK